MHQSPNSALAALPSFDITLPPTEPIKWCNIPDDKGRTPLHRAVHVMGPLDGCLPVYVAARLAGRQCVSSVRNRTLVMLLMSIGTKSLQSLERTVDGTGALWTNFASLYQNQGVWEQTALLVETQHVLPEDVRKVIVEAAVSILAIEAVREINDRCRGPQAPVEKSWGRGELVKIMRAISLAGLPSTTLGTNSFLSSKNDHQRIFCQHISIGGDGQAKQLDTSSLSQVTASLVSCYQISRRGTFDICQSPSAHGSRRLVDASKFRRCTIERYY